MDTPIIWEISIRCMRYPQWSFDLQAIGFRGSTWRPPKQTFLEGKQNNFIHSGHQGSLELHFPSDNLHIHPSSEPLGIHYFNPRLV